MSAEARAPGVAVGDTVGDASDLALSWANANGTPIFMIQWPSQQIVWKNQAATDYLDQNLEVAVHQDRLQVWSRAAGEALRQVIAQMGAQPAVWMMPRRTGSGFVLFKMSKTMASQGPMVAITAHFTDQTADHLWGDLGLAFGLTKAEAHLTQQLVAGFSVEELSVVLGITVETARTHVRRIYAKVNVKNREQLFAAVLPFRIS